MISFLLLRSIYLLLHTYENFLVAQMVMNPPAMWEIHVWSFGWEDALWQGHGSPLQWCLTWELRTEGFQGLQSAGSHRVWHNWSTRHTHTYKLNNYYSSAYRLGLHLSFSINPREALTGFSLILSIWEDHHNNNWVCWEESLH